MFDVGFWELAIIAVIALIVIGPDRLPRAARTAGLWVGRARRIVADVKADIDREVRESELADLKTVQKEIKSASSSIKVAGKKLVDDSELSDIKSASESLVESLDEELAATKKVVTSSEEDQTKTAERGNESELKTDNSSEIKS